MINYESPTLICLEWCHYQTMLAAITWIRPTSLMFYSEYKGSWFWASCMMVVLYQSFWYAAQHRWEVIFPTPDRTLKCGGCCRILGKIKPGRRHLWCNMTPMEIRLSKVNSWYRNIERNIILTAKQKNVFVKVMILFSEVGQKAHLHCILVSFRYLGKREKYACLNIPLTPEEYWNQNTCDFRPYALCFIFRGKKFNQHLPS